MLRRLIPRLRCPSCAPQSGALRAHEFGTAPGTGSHIEDGVLVCDACGRFYTIENGLADLVPPALEDPEARAQFAIRFAGDLARLGLERSTVGPAALDSVADQLKQRRHFDWYAENTTQDYQEYQNTPFWRAADEQTLRRWRPRVADHSWILDVGCADGRGGFYFTGQPGTTLIGFDISRKMVANAIRRARQEGFYDRSCFVVADATTPPFQHETFDVVITFGVLHHLPDPVLALRTLQDLLKLGGVHLALENNLTFVRPVFDLLMKVLPLWTEEAGREPLMSQAMVRAWMRGLPVRLTFATSVFVPPHLLNWTGARGADLLLRATDAAAQRLPLIRDHGGLIVFEAEKLAPRS